MSGKSENKELAQFIIQVIEERKPQTVNQLVIFVKDKFQISDQEIVELILKLQNDGKISFKKQLTPPSPNLAAYLKTRQTIWFWATIAMVLATVAVVFTIPEDFYPLVYIRYVLGTIFVLWLPGYAFIKALFTVEVPLKTSEKSLDTIERIALSLGMSLALVPIVGLLLNYTPWGIRLTPIVLSLLALTIVFATVAVIREQQARMKTQQLKASK
ncbi:MAG: DUF1616 domain-containing protein [Candidatus Bathycorpusculaceae bacterium]